MFVPCICHSGCFKHIGVLPEGPWGVNLPVWLCDWAVEEAHWTWHSCHSGWTDAQLHFLRSWQLQWIKISYIFPFYGIVCQVSSVCLFESQLVSIFFSNLPIVQSDLFFFPCLPVTTNECMKSLGICDATCVVHYGFPSSPKLFGSRLFCMSQNFQNLSDKVTLGQTNMFFLLLSPGFRAERSVHSSNFFWETSSLAGRSQVRRWPWVVCFYITYSDGTRVSVCLWLYEDSLLCEFLFILGSVIDRSVLQRARPTLPSRCCCYLRGMPVT